MAIRTDNNLNSPNSQVLSRTDCDAIAARWSSVEYLQPYYDFIARLRRSMEPVFINSSLANPFVVNPRPNPLFHRTAEGIYLEIQRAHGDEGLLTRIWTPMGGFPLITGGEYEEMRWISVKAFVAVIEASRARMEVLPDMRRVLFASFKDHLEVLSIYKEKEGQTKFVQLHWDDEPHPTLIYVNLFVSVSNGPESPFSELSRGKNKF